MTDNAEVQPVEESFYQDEPTESLEQEPTNEDSVIEASAEQEVEQQEKSEQSEATDDDENALYLELDGKEHDLDEVREWRDKGLMQKDYTKKTTALANDKKTFEAERTTEREKITQERAKVSDMSALLEVLVKEDEVINWAELKADDPERYIELKEKADQRRDALSKVKADKAISFDDPAMIQQEQGKLLASDPSWMDEGKPTEAFATDMKLIESYALKSGFTPDEFSQMTRAHYLTTILKAAKYEALQEKGEEIKAKREKVPTILKPKGNSKTEQPRDAVDIMYG